MKVTVATIDTACSVTWVGGTAKVTKSEADGGALTQQVQAYLQDEFEFPVGDTPDPGCTADYTIERRKVDSEFEMCSVMQRFPRLTGIDANVYTQE